MSAKAKVLVAMSGGVDSSVAAALLVAEGYEVLGLTLRLQPCDDDGNRTCCGAQAVALAGRVAEQLGFAHQVIDGRERFEEQVLRPAWQEYAAGRTPNPCVVCNRTVKFQLLLEQARALGAEHIATGHHARISESTLQRGVDRNKDQSYFLFSLTKDQLAHCLFPVGEFTKDRVRELARQFNLPNAERPGSQDACLESLDTGFAEALRLRFGAVAEPGEVVDTQGRVLGQHQGIHQFTIGQRRGLKIALGHRAYVVALDPGQKRVIMAKNEEELFAQEMMVAENRWLGKPPTEAQLMVEVQVRYRHRPVPARIEIGTDDLVRVRFDQPQRAICPGQAAVFYRGDQVLGGGWIAASEKELT